MSGAVHVGEWDVDCRSVPGDEITKIDARAYGSTSKKARWVDSERTHLPRGARSLSPHYAQP